ncbi:uncharacterized protein LAESUDRAFT_601438, partial [Laetiporus sulphureus 93-53]
MSRLAKATLVASLVTSTVIIWGVHRLQSQERETMYQGVLRDDQRRKEKMRHREAELQESLQRREIYESVQTVS